MRIGITPPRFAGLSTYSDIGSAFRKAVKGLAQGQVRVYKEVGAENWVVATEKDASVEANHSFSVSDEFVLTPRGNRKKNLMKTNLGAVLTLNHDNLGEGEELVLNRTSNGKAWYLKTKRDTSDQPAVPDNREVEAEVIIARTRESRNGTLRYPTV